MQKLGEVEESLWHVQAELRGCKERLDLLMKIADDGLGLISGLGFVSKDNNEVFVEKKGELDGPTVSKNNKGDGPDSGLLKRLVVRKDQNNSGL